MLEIYIVILLLYLFLLLCIGGWKLFICIFLLLIELLRWVLLIVIILYIDNFVVIIFNLGKRLYILLCIILRGFVKEVLLFGFGLVLILFNMRSKKIM